MRSRKSAELFAEATRTIPGGVNSPVRAWKSVGGTPLFIASGDGATISDVDGRTYVDFLGSWGPMILGHAHPTVVRAVADAAARGTSFGAPTAKEVELASTITAAMPSIDKLRLVSSGTEAVMSALRVARAATGRSEILKFSGCYHGHSDSLLVKAGSGAATLGIPDSEGVPAVIAGLTRVAEYNDLEGARAVLASNEGRIAAVVVEPIAGNMGVVPPEPGFLEGLREATSRAGSLLLFDEVITGFRVARGGAQERFGIDPDLTCLGKVIGGGLPVGAFGGRAELMDRLAPDGGTYQAGTLSGNPLAVAAGCATLHELGPEQYERLEALGVRLEEGLRRVLRDGKIPAVVQRVGSMWTLFFGVERVRCFPEAARADGKAYARFFHEMLDRGFALAPSPFEAAFLSLAHDEGMVDAFVEAARDALG